MKAVNIIIFFLGIYSSFSSSLGCDFKTFVNISDGKEETYKCEIESTASLENKSLVHKPGKSNSDVELLEVFNVFLHSIPVGFLNRFPNLLRVRIVRTGLRKVSRKNFQDLKRLQILNLGINKLHSLDDDTFDDLHYLQKLVLKENSIFVIKKDIFKKLVNLVILDLSENLLISLEAGMFKTNLKLVKIDFHRNELCSIPQNLFRSLASATSIKLSQNVCIDKHFTEAQEVTLDHCKHLDCPVSVFQRDDHCFEKAKEVEFIEILFGLFFGTWWY